MGSESSLRFSEAVVVAALLYKRRINRPGWGLFEGFLVAREVLAKSITEKHGTGIFLESTFGEEVALV